MSEPYTWQPCSYCGKPWRPFGGTRLTGHAKCALEPVRERFESMNAWRDERGYGMTDRQLATAFGVSIGTIRAWRSVVEKWAKGSYR